MENTKERSTVNQLDELTRRTVRLWWADGLWDFAVGGFFLLMGVWAYYLFRVGMFPSWTWPWPFITEEAINPLEYQIIAFTFLIIPVGTLYTWLAYKSVGWLKNRLFSGSLGEVHFPFWLKVEPKVYLYYFLFILVGWSTLLALFAFTRDAVHFISLLIVITPAAMAYPLGSVYRLLRYRVVAIAGVVLGAAAEFFLTTHAEYMQGPRSFFDVDPTWGNPGLPLAIWAAVYFISGAAGLVAALRKGGDDGWR